jgi:hypothetical protein
MIYETDNNSMLNEFFAYEIDWAYSCLKISHNNVTDEMIREYILNTEP